jgi:hypothetical protein
VFAGIAILAIVFLIGRWSPVPESFVQAVITAGELRDHVFYLASDKLQGRETGTDGIAEAENYIAAEFARYGLHPLPGEEDFFLEYTLYKKGFSQERSYLIVSGPGGRCTATLGRDFRPFSFSETGEVEAEVVFAGYGITAPEYDYDDYEGLDVEGKYVLVLRHEPNENDPESRFDGTNHTRHAYFKTKKENAEEHGAVGMILVTDPLHHSGPEDFRSLIDLALEPPDLETPASTSAHPPFLAVHIAQPIARQMLGFSLQQFRQLQQKVDEGTKPAALDIGSMTAEIGLHKIHKKIAVPARNVAGYVRGTSGREDVQGTDPDSRGEWIVVGAHHDHLGSFAGDGDTIYNGADDNGSGTAAVLELAEAVTHLLPNPERNVAFVTFSGEEDGLLGSRAFLEESVLPAESIVFMMNFDMIGRNPGESLRIYGAHTLEDLRDIVAGASERYALSVDLQSSSPYREMISDHTPFEERDIPYLAFFSGVHDDYHEVSDHAEKLFYERVEAITQVSLDVLCFLCYSRWSQSR